MNAVATIPTKSVTIDMANRYGMEPAAFEATLRNTIMPMSRGAIMQPTREEFAAFLLVAKEYRLNPITRQIYAFPKKGGGIIPVVSVDGWAFLINEHPAFDGMEFEDAHDGKGNLLSVTCRIFRKDRRMPVSVTEYLSECRRDTDPWAMQHRMLRHKALIQCARYAFAFSGIYDEDEAEKFAAIPAAGAAMRQDAPPPAPRREQASIAQPGPAESAGAPQPIVEHERARQDAVAEMEVQVDEDGVVSAESLLADIDERLGFAMTEEEVEEGYIDSDAEALLADYDGGVEQARALKAKHLARVAKPADKPKPADDFPGNDAIAQTAQERDWFAIPAKFNGVGAYEVWVCDAADKSRPGDEDRLYAAWNNTAKVRQDYKAAGKLNDDRERFLKERVQKGLDRILGRDRAQEGESDAPPPAPRRGSQEAQERREEAGQGQVAAEATKPASESPVAAYTARLDQAIAAAKTREEVERFWMATTDERDDSGATEDQRSKWRLARNKAKSALPSAEG